MFDNKKVYSCGAKANQLNTPGIDPVVKQMVRVIARSK